MATRKPVNFEMVRWPLLMLLLLVLFWLKTNSWPVAAVVNYKPIWRWQLDKQMSAQVGTQILENMITEQVIRNEIQTKHVQVDQASVAAKLGSIKKQVGTDDQFNQALAMQGLTVDQLKGQISLQMGLEKLVPPSTDSAKLQSEVYDLVKKLRNQAKVWLVGTPKPKGVKS